MCTKGIQASVALFAKQQQPVVRSYPFRPALLPVSAAQQNACHRNSWLPQTSPNYNKTTVILAVTKHALCAQNLLDTATVPVHIGQKRHQHLLCTRSVLDTVLVNARADKMGYVLVYVRNSDLQHVWQCGNIECRRKAAARLLRCHHCTRFKHKST